MYADRVVSENERTTIGDRTHVPLPYRLSRSLFLSASLSRLSTFTITFVCVARVSGTRIHSEKSAAIDYQSVEAKNSGTLFRTTSRKERESDLFAHPIVSLCVRGIIIDQRDLSLPLLTSHTTREALAWLASSSMGSLSHTLCVVCVREMFARCSSRAHRATEREQNLVSRARRSEHL